MDQRILFEIMRKNHDEFDLLYGLSGLARYCLFRLKSQADNKDMQQVAKHILTSIHMKKNKEELSSRELLYVYRFLAELNKMPAFSEMTTTLLHQFKNYVLNNCSSDDIFKEKSGTIIREIQKLYLCQHHYNDSFKNEIDLKTRQLALLEIDEIHQDNMGIVNGYAGSALSLLLNDKQENLWIQLL